MTITIRGKVTAPENYTNTAAQCSNQASQIESLKAVFEPDACDPQPTIRSNTVNNIYRYILRILEFRITESWYVRQTRFFFLCGHLHAITEQNLVSSKNSPKGQHCQPLFLGRMHLSHSYMAVNLSSCTTLF